jgi:hypothetical protein
MAWAAALFVLLAFTVASSIGRTTHGFIAYYGAARLLAAGELSAQAYDDRWFNEYVQRLTSTGVREIFTPNPPTMALLAMPLAGLPDADARAVWLLMSVLAYSIAVWFLIRRAPPATARVLPLLLFLLLVNPSVIANLRVGQAYLFAAALYALCAIALVRDRQVAAGAALGVLFAVKTTGAPLLLLLAMMRRWRALGAAFAAILLVVALTALRADGSVWTAYPGAARGMLDRPTIAVTASQSTLSLARRLCVPTADWNPRAPADCPTAADVVPAVLILLALAATIWFAPSGPAERWIAGGITLSVLAGPMAEDYHFAVLAVPIALLAPMSASRRDWLWLGLIAVLLLLPLRLTAFRFQDGWMALLAYPRLYAAWLLWGVHVFGARKGFRSLTDSRAYEPPFLR